MIVNWAPSGTSFINVSISDTNKLCFAQFSLTKFITPSLVSLFFKSLGTSIVWSNSSLDISVATTPSLVSVLKKLKLLLGIYANILSAFSYAWIWSFVNKALILSCTSELLVLIPIWYFALLRMIYGFGSLPGTGIV